MTKSAPRAGSARLADRAAQSRRDAVMRSIEDVAVGLFAERPMVDVTIDEIVLEAGTSIRTLYRYFPTKEEILTKYPTRGAQTLAENVRARPSTESAIEALRAAIGDTLSRADPDELDRWVAAVMNSTNPSRVARMSMSAVESALTAAIAERSDLDAGELWPSMVGALSAAAIDVGHRQWFARGGEVTTHVLAAVDIALHGLERTAPSPRA